MASVPNKYFTMTNPARLLIAAFCGGSLIIVGTYQFGPREDPAAPTLRSVGPVQPQAANLPAPAKATPIQTLDAKAENSRLGGDESADVSAISTFRKWAEHAVTMGMAQADQSKGMELAKARATSMRCRFLERLLWHPAVAELAGPNRWIRRCGGGWRIGRAKNHPHFHHERPLIIL